MPEDTGHFYLWDGSPCHGTLREARKAGAVPSVTTIFKAMAKGGLSTWQRKQAALAALSTPALEDETPESHMDRILLASEQVTKDAATHGTAIHDAIEKTLNGETCHDDYAPWAQQVADWLAGNSLEMVKTEFTVVHPRGFGGRVDLLCRDKDTGEFVLADFKTQNIKVKRGKKRPESYESFPMQLSAYRQGILETGQACERCLSLVIDSNEPVIHPKWWDEADIGSIHWQAFLSCFSLWKYLNKYDPCVREL